MSEPLPLHVTPASEILLKALRAAPLPADPLNPRPCTHRPSNNALLGPGIVGSVNGVSTPFLSVCVKNSEMYGLPPTPPEDGCLGMMRSLFRSAPVISIP